TSASRNTSLPSQPSPRPSYVTADWPSEMTSKKLLGQAHIGVTATVYTHVRLRLQRDAINTLSTALGSPETTETANSDGDEPPPGTSFVR
ncbi:hypothetical protein, partial [Streptomyces sp. NPDC003877]